VKVQESSKNIIPSRNNTLNNKVIVIDGLIGGGKGFLSSIVSSLPGVEMWIHRPEVEQICAMHSMSHISTHGATTLLKNLTDNETFNLSVSREINCRPSDLSSIFNSSKTRPWRQWQNHCFWLVKTRK